MRGVHIFFILWILSALPMGCSVPTKSASVNDLPFESIFVASHQDTLHTYCLLGTGFFRAPMAKNTDSLIQAWVKSHPRAQVIPVSTSGPTYTDAPKSQMTYCWVIDGKDTLNNELIRNGCFPGGTMMRPETWEEMSEAQRSGYHEKPELIVHVKAKDYERFLDQIKAAEQTARAGKKGIWERPRENDE